MAGILFRVTSVPVFDSNGDPVSGALAYFYLTGTLTETPVYSDEDLNTEHTNPVVANSAGVLPAIYMDTAVSYRVKVTDADGVEISDEDPYADLAPSALLTSIKTVDGSGSGLDADLVRGTTPSAFGLTVLDDADAATARATLAAAAKFRSVTNPSGGRSFDLNDADAVVRAVGTVGQNLTIDPSSTTAFTAGTQILIINDTSSSKNIVRGSGVTLTLGGTDQNIAIAAAGHCYIYYVGSNVWRAWGHGLT